MEHIEREALLRHLNDVWLAATPTDSMSDDEREPARMRCDGIKIAMEAIEDFSAADVVPVRHGRWEPLTMSTDNGMEVLWVHAKCGCERYEISNYCPNCGARMDGDGE